MRSFKKHATSIISFIMTILLGAISVVLSNDKIIGIVIVVVGGFISLGLSVWERNKAHYGEEVNSLTIRLSEWRNGLGKLEWHDGLTVRQRMIKAFGEQTYLKMKEHNLLYPNEIE